MWSRHRVISVGVSIPLTEEPIMTTVPYQRLGLLESN
jgi:hypothetical protein